MNKIRKSKWSKSLSIFMAFTFLTFMFNPTASYALSGGPGQPELEGFAPIGADNMVDLFTGDFSYNIPLLNVPGPDGGYPINLSYAAGIDMEQEASWVGLGWSLNPGAVNREVRGLPDDFKGEKITKSLSQEPNKTIVANIAVKDIEVYGADLSKLDKILGKEDTDTLGITLSGNLNLVYDNYTGFDIKPGVGFSLIKKDKEELQRQAENKPLTSKDPNDSSKFHIGFKYPYSDIFKKNESKDEKKSSLNNFLLNHKSYFKGLHIKGLGVASSGYAGSPGVVDLNFDYPRTTKSSRRNLKVGLTLFGTTGDLQVDVFLNTIQPRESSMGLSSYGYLYGEDNYVNNDGRGLMDFILDNQSILTPESKVLPVPIHTHDIFHVKAQGLSGTVRPHKGVLPHLSDLNMHVSSNGYGVDLELNGVPAEVKVGAGGDLTLSESYVGDWQFGANQTKFIKTALFGKYRELIPEMEPYYFSFKNEMTKEMNSASFMADENAASLKLATSFQGFSVLPYATNDLNGSSKISSLNPNNVLLKERTKRVKSFLAFTENDATNYFGFTRQVKNLETTVWDDVSLTSHNKIGAIEVTNENGSRYVYGIPAKNSLRKDATFSVEGHNIKSLADIDKLTTYSSSDNSSANSKGIDNFYTSTATPAHAHSWLLTEIVSPDYVDISENGPSWDDIGNYTAFDYSYVPNMATQTPTATPGTLKANYLPGHFSNSKDDKASISYYRKDVYFLNTVKTKTHIAVFETSPRNDSRGVQAENNSQFSNQKMRQLDKITLYNRADYEASSTLAQAIKTVNFEYAESINTLCKGIYNNGVDVSGKTEGKLTLSKVYYTVGNERTKMSLSPYEFTYSTLNPDYNPEDKDRWGAYQTNQQNKYGSNVMYPYANTSVADADANASAWNLTQIKLPTGGTIDVTYEADRYKNVQDVQAQNMYQILGFANNESAITYNQELKSRNNWVVIQLNNTVSLNQASEYAKDLTDVWYKALIKYKEFEYDKFKPDANSPFIRNDDAFDFVEGYLKIDKSKSTRLFQPTTEGYSDKIMLKVEKVGGLNPLRIAGLIDLKLNRSYLLDETGIDLSGLASLAGDVLGTIKSFISEALNLASGDPFITKAMARGWCDEMSTQLPSIIRLNAVQDKIGGGHRVKEITINDEWAAMGGASSSSYGQHYFYELENSKSSGVAQYEPSAGGEENPLHLPIPYSSEERVFDDEYLYAEMPIAESLHPSPVVGYSRVTVKNRANDIVTLSGAGVQEHQFYTAKDYPVKVSKTAIDRVNHGDLNKSIKFLGVKDFFQPGFSQGFLVETNNMHGKQKSSATYAANVDFSIDSPQQKVEYFYKTKNGYTENQKNYLDNETNVFQGDGHTTKATIGVEKDACIYFKESRNKSITGGLKANLTITAPFFPIVPSFFPNIDYSYGLTRTVAITKTIDRTAILEKVIATQDGAEVITENLGYDAEIGAPILTSVTNEYGKKTYDYRQPAHWYYEQAQGAYKNIGLEIIGDADNYKAYLHNGDVLLKGSSIVWINDISTESIIDKDGTPILWADLEGYKVVRSGYRNQQALQVGAIQSLSNPLTSFTTEISFLKEYNLQKPYPVHSGFSGAPQHSMNFQDCQMGSLSADFRIYEIPVVDLKDNDANQTLEPSARIIGNMLNATDVYVIELRLSNSACGVLNGVDFLQLIFPVNDDTRGKFDQFDIYYSGGGILTASNGTTQVTGITSLAAIDYAFEPNALACFGPCLEGVLNASATTLADDLKSKVELPLNLSQQEIDSNPYRYGYKGLLKTKEQKFYPEQRVQTNENGPLRQTEISTDGEYDEFFGYKWGSNSNPRWKTATEVTTYDYNGNPVEEKDAIGNYSTVLFGYERTLPIAVAGNAQYQNIAFDGFEDQNSSTVYAEINSHHLFFDNNVALSNSGDAHTGNHSLQLTGVMASADLHDTTNQFTGGDYVAYAWHKVGSGGVFAYSDNSTGTNPIQAEVLTPNIEGWELLRLYFTANGTSDYIQLYNVGGQFDDIRIQPFNSSMKCFVYDPGTQKTLAVLDENHFATLYNYDRDQVLVQVKKETEKGIKTIQSTHRATHVSTSAQ